MRWWKKSEAQIYMKVSLNVLKSQIILKTDKRSTKKKKPWLKNCPLTSYPQKFTRSLHIRAEVHVAKCSIHQSVVHIRDRIHILQNVAISHKKITLFDKLPHQLTQEFLRTQLLYKKSKISLIKKLFKPPYIKSLFLWNEVIL